MMPAFSRTSQGRLSTCTEGIQEVFNEVIKHYDCTILCGHRGAAAQMQAVATGASKTEFPNSKHNSYPSKAVDVAPYPVDWDDLDRFYHFGGFVMAVAKMKDIKLRWGADWNGNMDFRDEKGKLRDFPHFEEVE